jgi:transcription elongation factor Elf1
VNQLGKRFQCPACGTEVLCTKAGEGAIQCCGKAMEPKEARPLPSSD